MHTQNAKLSGIRTAVPGDIPAIVSVINAAYSIETFFGGTRTNTADVTGIMEKGEFLVSEDAAAGIVACCYTQADGDRGYVGMLSVEPSRQGTGLGLAMLEAAEEHCRRHGCRLVELTVLSLRAELVPFYRKLGYVETGTQELVPPPSRSVEVECHLITMSKALG